MKTTLSLLAAGGLAAAAAMGYGWLARGPSGPAVAGSGPDRPAALARAGAQDGRAVPSPDAAGSDRPRDGVAQDLLRLQQRVAALSGRLDALAAQLRSGTGPDTGSGAGAGAGAAESAVPEEPQGEALGRAREALARELAGMDRRFEHAYADPRRAREAEGAIEETLAGLEGAGGIFVEGLSCRTRECRLELAVEDPADLAALDQGLRARDDWYASATFDLGSHPDGTLRTVLFLRPTDGS